MSSLAFKMEKVYNLDKKKGPASEVYKFFKNLEQRNLEKFKGLQWSKIKNNIILRKFWILYFEYDNSKIIKELTIPMKKVGWTRTLFLNFDI